jgi:uncharacterized protein (TIGR02996 family)
MGTLVAALLEDARHRPEDDTPRLILADWLEEHGNTEADCARGRFLREQCVAAGLPPESPSRIDHERAALDLLLEHEPAWLGGLVEGAHGWNFARGLLWLETTFHALVDNLGSREPEDLVWVEGLSLIGKDGWERLRPEHPLLPILAGLDLSGSLLGVDRLVALLDRFPPGRLRHLDLSFNELDDDGLDALLHLPALSALTQLELRHNHLTSGTLRRLRHAPCWENLRSLNLRENEIGVEGILELSRSAPPALQFLGVGSGKIGGVQGLAQLLAAPLFPRLEYLDVGHSGLGASGMEELARYKGATRLRRLNLEANRLDDSALAHLARAQVLAGVEVLSLGDNPVSAAGTRLLGESRYLGRVAWLGLDHAQIEARGLRTLLRSEGLASLHRLDAARALPPPRGDLDDLDRAEVRVPLTTLHLSGVHLAAWSLRSVYALLGSLSLRKLTLARNKLGAASCPWLTDCSGLRGLVSLGLAGNNLQGLEALTRSQVLRGLRSLDLSGVPLGDLEGMGLLRSEAWGPRLRLIASPLGLSRPVLEQLHERYGRLDDHGMNVPRWCSSQ